MDVDLVKGAFSVYVVGVSFLRLLDEDEYFRLTAMKKVFGRSKGLLYHFLSHVIIPLLFALFYLCRGIVSLSAL